MSFGPGAIIENEVDAEIIHFPYCTDFETARIFTYLRSLRRLEELKLVKSTEDLLVIFLTTSNRGAIIEWKGFVGLKNASFCRGGKPGLNRSGHGWWSSGHHPLMRQAFFLRGQIVADYD